MGLFVIIITYLQTDCSNSEHFLSKIILWHNHVSLYEHENKPCMNLSSYKFYMHSIIILELFVDMYILLTGVLK